MHQSRSQPEIFADLPDDVRRETAFQERHGRLKVMANETPERFGYLAAALLRDVDTAECLRHADRLLDAEHPRSAYEAYRVAIDHAWGFEETAGRHDPTARAEGHLGAARCCAAAGEADWREPHLLLCLQDLAAGAQGVAPDHRNQTPPRDRTRDDRTLRICVEAGKLVGDPDVRKHYVRLYRTFQSFYDKRHRSAIDRLRLYRSLELIRRWTESYERGGQQPLFLD